MKEMTKLIETNKDLEVDRYEKAIAKWKQDVVEWGELASAHRFLELTGIAETKHPNAGGTVNHHASRVLSALADVRIGQWQSDPAFFRCHRYRWQ